MIRRIRSYGSIRKQLLMKCREAALCAIKVFNDPLVTFKSENYIILMVIAWTYLLHAYYRSEGIDYQYYRQGPIRKHYDRTKYGAKKRWELERCLNDPACPIDQETQKNLRFLIGLRHEIEHQMTKTLDNYLSGRYQACAVNFNNYIKALFGARYSLDKFVEYSIQFSEIAEEQLRMPTEPERIPSHVMRYITDFENTLTEEEFNSPRFSYRLYFTRKLANRPGQADSVVEFISPDSELAKTIEKHYWVRKEVERPKYRPTDVVVKVQEAGFSKFRVNPEHLEMWRKEDAKNPAKGYGVYVAGQWYWYDRWLERCIELCKAEGGKYR